MPAAPKLQIVVAPRRVRERSWRRGGLCVKARKPWNEHLHPRDRHGEFTDSGPGLPDTPDAPAVDSGTGRRKEQTRSNFVHPVTGAPMGKTETGDTFEALFATHGAHLLEAKYGHPPYKAIATTGEWGSRNTPLDFSVDHRGGELKSLSATTPNQKTAIKKAEVDRKVAAVEQARLDPLLVVQVIDQDAKRVQVYAYEAFASKSVTRMEHLGSYGYTLDDFEAAQQATGHHAKRTQRAAAAAGKAARADAGDGWVEEADIEPGDTVVELRDGVPYVYTQPARAETTKSALRGLTLELKVGPKGYIHGWIYVGPQALGTRVFHPRHGHGTVTSSTPDGVSVTFDSGHSGKYVAGGMPRGAKPPAARLRTEFGEWRDDFTKLEELGVVGERNLGGRDEALAEIWRKQGFDAKPRVATKEEMDAARAAGGVNLWRGLKGKQAHAYADQFRTGEVFPGLGIHGNGTYATPNRKIAGVFANEDWAFENGGDPKDATYSPTSAIMNLVLPASARVIDERVIDALHDELSRRAASATADANARLGRGEITPEEHDRLTEAAAVDRRVLRTVFSDSGRLASALGYDVVTFTPPGAGDGSPTEYVLLNRGILLVDDGHAAPGDNIKDGSPGTRALEIKVGPKGYIHGWIYVGPQAVGARVFHSHHRHGTVVRAGDGTVDVHFDSGHEETYSHQDPAKPVATRTSYAEWRDDLPDLERLEVKDGSDNALAEIWRKQGFDAKPRVVDRAELRSEIRNGGVELWRGLHGDQAQQYAEEFRSGPAYAGLGIYGNGTYASTRKAVAESFAHDDRTGRDGELLHLVLPADARTVTYSELGRMHSELYRQLSDQTTEVIGRGVHGEISRDEAYAQAKAIAREMTAVQQFFGDPGRFASALGYDALVAGLGHEKEYIILNRGSLLVEEPDEQPETLRNS